jgi:hypothetical protein
MSTKYPLEWGWHTDPSPDSPKSSDPTPAKRTILGRDGDTDVAAVGDLRCDGPPCSMGGTYGTTAMFKYKGQNLCWDCAAKARGVEDEPRSEQWRILQPLLIKPSK